MVRRFSISMLLALAALTFAVPQARAQILGALSTASVEEVGAKKVGAYLGITGDYVSLMGQFRYGVAPSFDLGVKGAYVDFSEGGGSTAAFNGDAKIQLLDVYLQDPVDLSIGPELTYFRAHDVSNWYFGGYVALSKEFTLDNTRPLTPYVRLGARMHRLESPTGKDDEFDLGFSGGVEYGISGYTQIYGEVVIEDTGSGMYVGAQYQLP
jgi:hypothetical protein